MKWLIYLTAFAAALLAPVKRMDVGKLQPVQLIYLYMEEVITVETDTGDIGRGETIPEAIDNLIQTTPGIVYLDTADFLLLDESAVHIPDELKGYLEPDVRVCVLEGEAELEKAAKYLAVHPPETKLADWNQVEERPYLRSLDGILILENNSKNLKKVLDN